MKCIRAASCVYRCLNKFILAASDVFLSCFHVNFQGFVAALITGKNRWLWAGWSRGGCDPSAATVAWHSA